MSPEQISIFDEGKQNQVADSFINRKLFSEYIIKHYLPNTKEWRSAKVSNDCMNVIKIINEHFQRTGSLRSPLEHLGWHFAGQRGYFLLFSTKPDGPIRLSAMLDEFMDTGATCRLMFNMRDAGADWGILSDGSNWRLFHSGLFSAADRFLEFKQDFLEPDYNKMFYLFFGANISTSSTTFADRMFRLSRERTAGMRNSLRNSLRGSATVLSRGFLAAELLTTGAAPTPEALDMIYKHALVVIQRLIYIFFAESTGVLPGDGETYISTIGLKGIASRNDFLAALKKRKDTLSFELWESVDKLLTAIRHGDAPLGVPCLAGELTDIESHPFLNANRVPDAFMAEAIELLALKEEKYEKPGDGYGELDASDIISACELLSDLQLKIAEKSMTLIFENGNSAWVDRSKAKWKETLEAVSKGDAYLDSFSWSSSSRLSFETWIDYAYAALSDIANIPNARIFIPRSGAGSLYAAALDSFSSSIAALTDSDGLSKYSSFLRLCARRIIASDANPINVEFTKFAALLSTLDEEPAEVLFHNIRLGSALCGARPSDIVSYTGNLEISLDDLYQWANDVEEVLDRQRPGLAGYKARENGLKKVVRRSDKVVTPELWRAAGWKDDFQEAFSESQKEPPLLSNSFRVLHPAVHFTEVFYSRAGDRTDGFALILNASSNDAHPTEISFFIGPDKDINNFSFIETALERFVPLLSSGGTYAIIDDRNFFSTLKGKTFLRQLECSPEVKRAARIKIKGRKTIALVRNK